MYFVYKLQCAFSMGWTDCDDDNVDISLLVDRRLPVP